MEPDRDPLDESPGNPNNNTRKLALRVSWGKGFVWSLPRFPGHLA